MGFIAEPIENIRMIIITCTEMDEMQTKLEITQSAKLHQAAITKCCRESCHLPKLLLVTVEMGRLRFTTVNGLSVAPGSPVSV